MAACSVNMTVPPQIHFAVERPSALTSKRFESKMLAAVCNKIGGLAKTFATLTTLVRFFPGMHKHMFLHVRFLVKPFATVIARKWPDISVY